MSTDASWPSAENLEFVERLYADYVRNPASVPPSWQAYFAEMGASPGSETPRLGPAFSPGSIFHGSGGGSDEGTVEEMVTLQHRADRLIRAFRVRGHIQARVDPLNDHVRYVPELDPQHYGFSDQDLQKLLACETMRADGRLPLQRIISRLRQTYCGAIGVQYMHIDDLKMRHWVMERIEGQTYWEPLPRAQQLRIFTRLTDAVVFEQFLRKKFVGAKSFSLMGAESLIPLLDLAIERAAEMGVREIVLGMAHRGRLNVLANIIGKSPREIFREFEDKDPDVYAGGGDVKYHMGYSSDYLTGSGRRVHLSLCFNPSHLEFVNPVALGRVRSKQDRAHDQDRGQVMSLLVHGDAAFIGEGVVQETLNLSRLPGYRVGGTIHIIVNNQIGFTTPPSEGRSVMYATSVAKMLPAPILHVNGEDPEAVARCIQLALEFRQKFKQDVVIDMYCYRRLGHNEGDEPSFTQPLLYQAIEKRKSVRDAYLERLLQLGGITADEAEDIARRRQDSLDQHLNEARGGAYSLMPPSSLAGVWKGYRGGPESDADEPETALAAAKLSGLLKRLTEVPEDFTLHPKLKRFMEQRRLMAEGKQPLDWSAGEALGFASVVAEGYRLRLSGQDCGRGTFSHRHAVLHDYQTGLTYTPLQHLAEPQGAVEVLNSPLSEVGVLGFEYGYSLDWPDGLVIWEAQFGDFVNVAQAIIDQFIISGEDKWRRLSSLVMLLPHGFEGAGPEHSSGRLERFLALGAEDNMQVVVPSTPAQFYHVLRRQTLRRWRKPLVVFTPKSMLRLPEAVSPLEDLARGRFQKVIPDREVPMAEASRVLLCAGKIYYELEARRRQLARKDVAIVRLEQLYPFPKQEIEGLLAACRPGTNVIWVQEEPENMGAWRYLRVTVSMEFPGPLPFTGICRPASASPATGSAAAHHLEQEQVLERAFLPDQAARRPRTETVVGIKQLAITP